MHSGASTVTIVHKAESIDFVVFVKVVLVFIHKFLLLFVACVVI